MKPINIGTIFPNMCVRLQVHIHSYRAPIIFGIFHVISTNLCLWLNTLTDEIVHEYAYIGGYSGYPDDGYVNNTYPDPSPAPYIYPYPDDYLESRK